jgi:hypothetical protein
MTEPRYWLSEPGGTAQGPYERAQVTTFATAGRIGPQTMACAEGTTQWIPVANVLSPPSTEPPLPPPAPPIQPPAGPSTVPTAEEQALGFVVPIGTDPLAIVASYVGLVGLAIWPLAPVALLLGILALRRRGRYPHQANSFRCIASIVLGALGILVGLAVVIAIALST